MLRLRGQVGAALLRAASRLLGVGAADPDFDRCIHCGATGCENGTAEHDVDCPAVTGLHVVALRDLWPHGPTICDRCDTTLWPGASYTHIRLDDFEEYAVYEVACVGCAALAAVAP